MRDTVPSGTIGTSPAQVNYNEMPTPNGVMHYVELDAGNLAKWLSGAIAGSGHGSYDPLTAPNDYSVYFSDRRGNWVAGAALPGPWPPLSFSLNETGEYGFSDFINPSVNTGCPNRVLDTPEDLDQAGILFTYGQDPYHSLLAPQAPLYLNPGTNHPWTGGFGSLIAPTPVGTTASGAPGNIFAPYGTCTVVNPNANSYPGPTIWPGVYIIHANEARENPTLFFRRALKIVNGDMAPNRCLPGSGNRHHC